MTKRSTHNALFALLASLSLAACENTGETGKLSVGVTDAPVDGATEVSVTFTEVTVKHSNGDPQIIILDEPLQIDLLSLSGNNAVVLLDSEVLAAGDYQWIRLGVDDNPENTYLIDSMGGQHSLRIPSSENTGLKLHNAFTIEAENEVAFTIDFDLRKSVHMTGPGEYILRPTLRIVETEAAASLSGTVDNTLVGPDCSPGVYLFNEGDPLNDLDGSEDDAIYSVAMPQQGPYDYSAGFLPPGSYSIAFTCDAENDANDTEDDITFTHETSITLEPGEDATFDFMP